MLVTTIYKMEARIFVEYVAYLESSVKKEILLAINTELQLLHGSGLDFLGTTTRRNGTEYS